MNEGSSLDDESLVAQFLSVGKAHADAAQRFANDYGNVSVPPDDERHPTNWTAEHRRRMHTDRDTLVKLAATFAELTDELVRRRVG